MTLDYEILNRICDRAFYIALRMIHAANQRPNVPKGEPKVGGHATACSSSQHILAALHLVARKPEDYVACKPHVSPMDHAFNFLLHNFRDNHSNERFSAEQRKRAMLNLRHFSKEGEPVFQSYHADSDPDSHRFFPSGSVGIPPVNALYTALAYEYAKDHGFKLKEDPYFWCLMGDSEFREGSLAEAMPDAGERQLKHVVWIVDYNRQNLDGTRVANEEAFQGSDADRMAKLGTANGWDSIILKHGSKRKELFKRPGGSEFKRVIDECFSDFEFQGLLQANRPELTRSVLEKKSSKLGSFLKELSDEQVHEAFLNLGGHDIAALVEAYNKARSSNRPTLIIAYTIKGYQLRCQAKSGNHSTLPDEDELEQMAKRIGASFENPFDSFSPECKEEQFLEKRRKVLVDGIDELRNQVKNRQTEWKKFVEEIEWPADFNITALKFNPVAHTQWMWGQVAAKLDRLARGEDPDPKDGGGWEKIAKYFLTMAPDVGSSTNTSPNMNGKLYGDVQQEDFEALYDTKDKKAPDVVPKVSDKSGHLRFEIAEGNCMSAVGSFGKFFDLVGIPFYPAMTIYDFFIKRAHDQYYYNLYWKSRFVTIGTPSGVTLAPEGAQHSWKSDFQIPHCVTWEPCFAKELEWILADSIRLHFSLESKDKEAILIRCVTKGLTQKLFLDSLKKQVRFKASPNTERITPENESDLESLPEADIWEKIRQDVLKGAYALIDYRGYSGYAPGDNVVHIFAMGALGAEAIAASEQMLEKGVFANVFIVTSPDLLLGNYAYNDKYTHLKNGLGVRGDLHVNADANSIKSIADWYSLRGNRVPIVSVHDGEPGLLDNIGSVVGVKHRALAVRKTSKSGTTEDIFRYHGLDATGIVEACEVVLSETAEEGLEVHPSVINHLLESPKTAN